jgi:hypothetical protein
MPNKIAIIGFGPTAVFAAKAAYDMGYQVEIYTDQQKPMPPGATWLHWLPEDVSHQFKPVQIYVVGQGTSEQYTKRQWGQVHPSSFPLKPVWEVGYNPTQVLDKLLPTECNVNLVPYRMSDADVRDLSVSFDLVFQTFPTREHRESQPQLLPFVAAARLGTEDPTKNYVVYNGTKKGIVVREASLFGNHFVEFPKGMTEDEVNESHTWNTGYKVAELKDLDPRTQPVQQPVGKIKLLGRWAQWDRRVLSHDAYNLAVKFIEEMQNVPVT